MPLETETKFEAMRERLSTGIQLYIFAGLAIACFALAGCVRSAIIITAIDIDDEASIPTALSDARGLMQQLGFRVEHEEVLEDGNNFNGSYIYSKTFRFAAFVRLRSHSLEIGFVDHTHPTGLFSPEGKELSEHGLAEVQRIFGNDRVRIVRRTNSVEPTD